MFLSSFCVDGHSRLHNIWYVVGFEVLTAVVMKSTIFWEVGAELAICFHAGFLLGLFFHPENVGDMSPRNVG
jgi:hypothetical protein